jgi:5-methylcytosine-specific restriction endonuclease McrBC GTP-binding regulatory subunit McrB
MEMPDYNDWKIDIVPVAEPKDPKNLINGKVLIPQNLWFIGTANKDDSTFTITDKVYDRALAIALNQRADLIDAPYTDSVTVSFEYLDELFKRVQSGYDLSDTAKNAFAELDRYIQDTFKIAFGNRIMKQIKLFVPVYMACGFSEFEGLDYMLASKILRKFEMLNLTFLKKELEDLKVLLDKLFGKEEFKVSKAFIEELKKLG